MDLTEDDFHLLALVNRELNTYIENMEDARYGHFTLVLLQHSCFQINYKCIATALSLL